MPSWPAAVLIGGWWLLHPLCLFAYSHFSGNSVFLHRYLFVALPGAVLAAVCVAGVLLPPERWRQAALLLGVGVLLLMGQWNVAWPRHDRSDWRGAAQRLQELRLAADTPVLVPSPFYEARPPAWTPDYPLPGFLYAHLEAYPIPGTPLLFPFNPELEAFAYAEELLREKLPASGRFAIYGGDRNVRIWRDWLAGRPELAGWRHQTDRRFGDVWVATFERAPAAAAGAAR